MGKKFSYVNIVVYKINMERCYWGFYKFKFNYKDIGLKNLVR